MVGAKQRMKTILVDDEPLAMERFSKLAKNLSDINIIGKFDSPLDAVEFAKNEEVKLAVLDIDMPEMNGIELGKELRKVQPNIVLIFITGYEQYALDAFNICAAAYLMKPFDIEDLKYAVESAMLLSKRNSKEVMIKTFGRFDVFVNEKPIFFKSSKAKELLALLVDAKGSTITSEYAISILWEDKNYDENSKSLYYKVAKSLEKTLQENGIERIIIKTRYARCINKKEFSCDYYKMLSGDEKVKRSFVGEYMSQYSWAEETLAYIINKIQ